MCFCDCYHQRWGGWGRGSLSHRQVEEVACVCFAQTQNVCHFGNCAMCNVAGLAGRAAGIGLPANPASRRAASGQTGRETGRRQPSSGEQVMSVSGRRDSACPLICELLHLPSRAFFLCAGQKACVLYERATKRCCKLGPALKSKFNRHSNVQEYISQVEE